MLRFVSALPFCLLLACGPRPPPEESTPPPRDSTTPPRDSTTPPRTSTSAVSEVAKEWSATELAEPPHPEAAKQGSECALELFVAGEWEKRLSVACPVNGRVGFLVAGDVGLPTETLQSTLATAKSFCAANGCDIGLLPGDLLYDDGLRAAQYWPLIWDRGFAQLGFPFAAVLGNHEYRHEPNAPLKRKVIAEADGRNGLISPSSSYALRLVDRDGQTLVAIAAVDTDSVSNPTPEMPGLGEEALAAACGTGAPTVWLGHHPPSSQGLHHTHEAHVETALRERLKRLTAEGCKVVVATAGHDHDLQVYGPDCEELGTPGVVVSGPAARGFRAAGPQHLSPCPVEGEAVSRAFAGLRVNGGFAWMRLDPQAGKLEVQLVEAMGGGEARVLSVDSWLY